MNDLPLQRTALFGRQVSAGARMVPFAGYEMPVNFADGIIQEHLHTRSQAGLFDVSHMGLIRVAGPDAAGWLETLMPVDILDLPCGKQRYGLLLNDRGGVIDDLMITRHAPEQFTLVVNAARKADDLAHLDHRLGSALQVELADNTCMLALQGPDSGRILKDLGQPVDGMFFMDCRDMTLEGIPCTVSRAGYTGEDGFEIIVNEADAGALADRLTCHPSVRWCGLGARDSLRLEAGLCLYGHELSDATTPVEAGLLWAVSHVRRADGERAGGFPGADTILDQIPDRISRRLTGLRPDGRAPVREGSPWRTRPEILSEQ